MSINHDFTNVIRRILHSHFDRSAEQVFERSELLQYLNIKTKAANRGSKSRAGFANHYAIYVLIEDYLNKGFHLHGGYEDYAGAQFTTLLRRQRELPFGSKLQNHALNHRLNEEFKKYFPTASYQPIIHDVEADGIIGHTGYRMDPAVVLDEYSKDRPFTFNPDKILELQVEIHNDAYQTELSDIGLKYRFKVS